MQVLLASDLATQDHNLFMKAITEGYSLIDWICEDYPDHWKQFWTKYVPGIFTGERQIEFGYEDDRVVGVTILKKDLTESKICTLYVSDLYRGRGVATALLEHSFDWLGTGKPLITIADYKLSMFSSLISRYS